MGIVVGIVLAAKAVRLGGMSFPLIHRQAAAIGSSNTANPRLGPSALKQGCPRSLSQTSDSWLIPEPGDGGRWPMAIQPYPPPRLAPSTPLQSATCECASSGKMSRGHCRRLRRARVSVLELLTVLAVFDARRLLRLSRRHPAQRLQACNDVVRISRNETGNTLEAGPDSHQPTGTSDNGDLLAANHHLTTQLRHVPDAGRVPRSVSPAVAAPCLFRRPCMQAMPSSSRSFIPQGVNRDLRITVVIRWVVRA
jgi:hypothetical protein